MVVTADHSTGGIAFSAGYGYLENRGGYWWQPKWLENITMTPYALANNIVKGMLSLKDINSKLGFDLSSEEMNTLRLAQKQGVNELYESIKKLLDVRTNTGWTTDGHTPVDVQVFAMGSNKQLFSGAQDNAVIGATLMKLID